MLFAPPMLADPILSVTTAAALHEERAHGSLDLLLATPLPTAMIVPGKWRWAFRCSHSCRPS